MSYSYTIEDSITFSRTHAKHIAAKVATDLKRLQRFYGKPSDLDIEEYETEIIELLKAGYLKSVSYGFRRHGCFIEPTLKYTAQDLGGIAGNDDTPGKIRPGANIEGASFYSYLTYSSLWDELSVQEQKDFKDSLPFQRSGANQPLINGYLSQDKTYSAGGRALNRNIVRSY